MSAEAEFSGRSWGVGVVRGVRAFDVDAQGRLKGVSYPSVWTPGENVATCKKMSVEPGWQVEYSLTGYPGQAIYVGPDGNRTMHPPRLEPKPHDMGECSHGFYAYYDGSNDYKSDARISAVVEGYGETIIGTRGFRAQKARIVALCIPDQGAKAGLRSRLQWFRKIHKLALMWYFIAAFQAVISLVKFLGGEWQMGLFFLVASLVYIACGFFSGRHARSIRSRNESGTDVSSGVVEKVRRNYPDVTIFTSFAQMVAAFPPDKGLEPSPDSDPDFWTRA